MPTRLFAHSAVVVFLLSLLAPLSHSTGLFAQPYSPPPEMLRDVAESVYGRAFALERANRMLEAEPLYVHAIDTDPGYLPAYLGYARALVFRGHRDEALRALLFAPRRAYGAEREAIDLARALHGLGDTDQALGRLRQFESSPEALRVLVELAAASGRFPEALAAARRIADLQSDNRQNRVMVRALAQLVADADAVRAISTDVPVLRRLLRE